MKTIEVILLGAPKSGKTSLISALQHDKIVESFLKEEGVHNLKVGEGDSQQTTELKISDIGDKILLQKEFQKGTTYFFVLVFSLVDNDSFEHAKNLINKLPKDLDNLPRILVGTKRDLRENNNSDHVQKRFAFRLQRE